MSTFGTGSTTTAGASITLRAFTGTDGQTAGTDGLVPGPAIAQQGYVLGAGGDWVLSVKAIDDLNESSTRIATTNFVQTLIGQAQLGGGNANLSALGDVSFANLATGQFLQYNTNNDNNWSNVTLTLGTISDVDLAGLQDGNALVYDAAANNGNGGWVPGQGGGGGAANLNDLGDVAINGGADKHFLVRNAQGDYVNRLISTTDLSNSDDIILRDGTVAFTGNVDLGTNNLTNVGDVSATTITIVDNNANSFIIKEGGNNYLRFNTINNSESVIFEKDTAFNQRVDFNNTVVFNEAGNGIDFRVETGTETHAIFTDGGNDRVGIFQDNPTVPLDVVGDTKIDGNVEITGTLTSSDLLEKARDAAGTALANGQHTGIAFANDDANDRINATVDITGFSIRDLSDVSNDALVNGKILKVVNGALTQADETDTNTQLTDEQVQDIVGGMVDGGTETDITVTYDDANAKLNFVVDNTIARLDDPDLTGTPTAPTAGIATDTTQIATTAFVHSLIDSDIGDLNLGTASQSAVADFLASDADINDLGGISTAGAQEGKILKFNAQNNLVVSDETGKTQEEIEDIVGAMVEGNTETGITVSYVDNDANAGKLNFVVDNTEVAFLAGVQSFTGNKTFTGNVVLGANATATTQNASNNSTSVATTAYVDSQIDSDIATLDLANNYQGLNANLTSLSGLNIVDGSMIIGDGNNSFEIITIQGGVENFLKSTGRVASLSDVVVNNDAVTNANHILVSTGLGGFESQTISTTNLSNSGNIILNNAGADFGAFDYNFTGANSITVPAPANGADATTKTYVDTQVATKQDSDDTLTALAGLTTGEKKIIYSTANDTLEMTDLSDNAKTFIGSNAELGNLDKVVIDENIGNANDGESLRWDGANLRWNNSKLAFGDLNQNAASTQNVALLNQEQSFTNNITFTQNVVLGANATANTQANNDDSTKVATTAFVKAVVNQVGNVSDLDDLTDVNLGADNGNGVAEAVGQVLRISAVDNDGNATFRNENLDFDDLSDVEIGGVAEDVGQVIRLSTLVDGVATYKNEKLSASDLDDTTAKGLAILNSADSGAVRTEISAQESNARLDDIAGLGVDANNFIVGDGANLTLKTPTEAITSLGMGVAQHDLLIGTGANTFGTIATTAGSRSFLASSAGINDLADVLITDPEAPATKNAHILVFDADGGDNDNQFKNVALSGDITINNAGVSTIANNAITTAKINDSEVTNAKLANSYVAITDGTATDNLPLGQTLTFNATQNETTVVVTADQGNGADGVAITIGLPDDVTIGQDLTVTRNLTITGNLTVNGTTTTVSTEQLTIEDPVSVLNANDAASDVGYFFTNPGASGDQIFIFDNTDQIFKMAQVPNGKDGEDSDFNPTVFSGLKIGALTATTGSFSSLLNADGGIEIDNGGNKFTVSNAGAVVSVGGITDITTASAFFTGTTIGDIRISNGEIITTANDNNLSFSDNNLSTSGNLTLNTDKFVVAGATGNLTINTNKFTVDGATGNTLVAGTLEVTLGATFTQGLSANDQNITNVADIALDTISSDGTTIQVLMDDNVASAFEVKVPVENDDDITYFKVDTSDGAELITFEKNVQFNGTTNISANFDQAITINDSGNDADFRVEGSGQENLLFTDGGNNRVGINTNTPSTQFHVVGNSTLAGATTQSDGHVVFNNGLGNFDFRVAGDNQANLLYVDASVDRIGIRTDTPARVLDVVGDVGISTTLNVTGKTTLVGSLDLTTGSTTGITFRSEIAENGADAGDNVSLLRVNVGGSDGQGNPNYQEVIWNPDMDRFEVESGLKSTGNFAIGNDVATINATTGVTSIKGATTINNSGGTADLIVQNNGADVLNVDVSAGLTTITGIATVSSQLKTDDLRGLTAGTGNFHIRLEDNIANALEILDATNSLSFMTFTTTDDSESITLSQDAIFKKEISIENTNTNGLFFNSNRSAEVSEDATLITIEGGSNKNDVVFAWDTSDNALNLNAESQLHLQGLAGSNALTLGGALVANATIVMTTAGAITLDGTLDSPTINTNKISNKNATSLVVEVADNQASALFIQQGGGSAAGGEDYLTLSSANGTERITLHQNTTIAAQLQVNASTTMGGVLNLKSDNVQPLIKANSDLTGENTETDATLIEVQRGTAGNAKIKWDETSNVFEFDKTLSAEGNFQVGIDAAAPKATINSTTGNLSTDGTISATSSITTDSVLNFKTASQGAILFNSDLAEDGNPADADDFGLTVNRGAEADAKLYWDEGDDVWKIETGNVEITESLVVDSDANGKITISSGQIVSNSGAISFDNENLSTTGTITAAKPVDRVDDTTQVPTTSWVLDLRLGDFDQVDTTAFDTSGQILVWNQEQSKFEKGAAVYGEENARDDVGAALANGTHTGATTITFTNDDANNVINLALGITTEDLTDVSSTNATNNQVLRFTTAEGDNQNKYVPTTLGTAADVDTGLSNGNIPTLTTHYHSTKSNETADLIITGRIIESIDYGLVSEEYDANTDFTIDFGAVNSTIMSSIEDYGQLVV